MNVIMKSQLLVVNDLVLLVSRFFVFHLLILTFITFSMAAAKRKYKTADFPFILSQIAWNNYLIKFESIKIVLKMEIFS